MAATENLDDLIGDDKPSAPAKKAVAKKAAPAKKAVAKKAVAPAAKKAAPAAKKAAAKPAKASAASTTRGEGKFYPGTPEERAELDKQIARGGKPITTQEAAEKYGVETFKARLSFVRLEAEGKGKTSKTGSVITFTPKK